MLRHFILGVLLVLTAACSDSDSKPGKSPESTGKSGLRGYSYHSDVLMGNDRQLNWVQDAVVKYRRSSAKMLPGEVTELKRSGCSFPRPNKEHAVYAAHVEDGVQSSAIHHISNRQLTKRAEAYVAAYIKYKGNLPAMTTFTAGSTMRTVNVVVTDESQPVFLVLAAGSDVVWNIQKAPAARIDQIVVISGKMVGLANVPEETRVHAVYGKSLRGCRVLPARIPEDHWSFVQNVEEFGVGADKLKENKQSARAFGRWLSKTFRISHTDVIGDAGLSNVLFGGMPTGDAVLEFKPLKDARVMLSPADHILVASKDDFEQRSRKMVREVAAEAAGGSLDTLVAGVN